MPSEAWNWRHTRPLSRSHRHGFLGAASGAALAGVLNGGQNQRGLKVFLNCDIDGSPGIFTREQAGIEKATLKGRARFICSSLIAGGFLHVRLRETDRALWPNKLVQTDIPLSPYRL